MKTCKTVRSRQAVVNNSPREAMISLGLVVPLALRRLGEAQAFIESSAPSTPPSALGGRRRNSGGSNSAERRRTPDSRETLAGCARCVA